MNDFESKINSVGKEETNIVKKTFQKYDEAKMDIKGVIQDNRGAISDIVFLVISSLVILAILGLNELVNMNFDWSMYSDIAFWVDYVATQFAVWSIRVIVRVVADRKEMRENMQYLQADKSIQDYVDKDSKSPFIEEEAEIDRLNRKTIAFKNSVKRDLLKLSNKHQITNIIPYMNDVESGTNEIEVYNVSSDKLFRSENHKNKIENKLKLLVGKLSPKWLDANLQNQKVKFNDVSRTILVSGKVSKSNNELGANYKENNTTEFMKLTIPSFLLMASLSFLILPMFGSGLIKDGSAWFKLFVKIGMVGFSGLMMWFNNPELFRITKLKAIVERDNTLNIYDKKHSQRLLTKSN